MVWFIFTLLILSASDLRAQAIALPAGSANDAEAIPLTISRQREVTEIKLKGREQWIYQKIKKNDRQMQINLPTFSMASVEQLQKYSDPFVEKVEVQTQGVNGQYEVLLTFKEPFDIFDYQTEDPPLLIFDFFKTEEQQTKTTSNSVPIVKAIPTDQTKQDKSSAAIAAANTPKGQEQKAASRAPSSLPAKGDMSLQITADSKSVVIDPELAGETTTQKSNNAAKGKIDARSEDVNRPDLRRLISDGSDPNYQRFWVRDEEINEKNIIMSRQEVYLHFPALSLGSPHLKVLQNNPPIYEIKPTESAENKEARLVYTLFQNKRTALFVKTARQFIKSYPHSKYDEIIRYLLADTYYELWRKEQKPGDFETAIGLYEHLVESYPDSPLASRTLLLIGYSYLDRGDNLNAMRVLQLYLRSRPKSPLDDQIKISIAEAHMNLNRFDEALERLDEVEKKAVKKIDAVEAAYRKGDVYLRKKDLEKSVAAYQEAQNKYPEYIREFPNAQFNMAEAQFWLKKYKESVRSFREFLKAYPQHNYGAYAMTRVGELFEILGIDPERSKNIFLESQFRYRDGPGAQLARLRLLTNRMPSMKKRELEDALKEIEELKKIPLQDVQEFVTLLVADGHFKRKDYDASNDELIKFYKKNTTLNHQEIFQKRIARNISESIRNLVNEGKYLEALKIYSGNKDSWLKFSQRYDTSYYVARAYEMAGVDNEAGDGYVRVESDLNKIKGTDREKEVAVFEHAPSFDELRLRKAAVAFNSRQYVQSGELLTAIQDPPQLDEAGKIERAELSANLAEIRGRDSMAIAFLGQLMKNWEGQPEALNKVRLRLSRLYIKQKEYKKAESEIEAIQKTPRESISDDIMASALELKGDVRLARGHKKEAVLTYKELLDEFENKRPLASVRFRAGKILFDGGDTREAEKLWTDFKGDDGQVWAALAKEQLENAKFRNDYKKYIDEIPAMSAQK